MKSSGRPTNPLTVVARNLAGANAPLGAGVGLQVTDRAAREEVLHRAYAIWESEGRPTDRKLENWLKAEAELAPTAEGNRDAPAPEGLTARAR